MAVDPDSARVPTDAAAEAGIALVTVLWFVAAMSALAVAMVGLGRDTGLANRHAVLAVEARAAAASAVEIAAAVLYRGQWPAAGFSTWQQGALSVRVTAVAESTKIDLNAASDDLIEALAAVAVAAAGRSADEGLGLGHAILDWRDPAGTRRLAGADADAYARAGRIGRPRHGPFRHVGELRGVLGMDHALFALLEDAVTVHHGESEPAGPRQPPLVRAAMDRARGLGSSAESALVSIDDGLNEGADVGTTPSFVADPRGLYSLDIEIVHEDGPSFRQATVIWIDPPLGNRRHAILEQRSSLLPSDTGPTGEVAWPGR